MPNTIIRIEPNGPDGKLKRLDQPFRTEIMATDQPLKRGYRYIDDVERGLWVGVWEATPFTMTPHAMPYNEFMLVVKGSVTMVESSGGETTIRAGESFVNPQGQDGYWKQTEVFRKFSFGFRDPAWQRPANQDAPTVIKLDHNGKLEACPSPAAELLVGPAPVQHAHEWFRDATGQFVAGVQDTTAYRSRTIASPRHDWRHVLEGAVTLTDAVGTAHRFTAGDSFLVPLGVVCDWRCDEYLRTVYCGFQPKSAHAG
jgi:uncharacterized cupin superfamily protein